MSGRTRNHRPQTLPAVAIVTVAAVIGLAIPLLADRRYGPYLGPAILWLAAGSALPLFVIHKVARREWFHPLVFPVIYLAVGLFAAPIWEVIANRDLSGEFTLADLTGGLITVMGLTYIGFGGGVSAALFGRRPPPIDRAAVPLDWGFVRRVGGIVLVVSIAIDVVRRTITAGTTYGANQTTATSASAIASVAYGAIFISIILITVGNAQLGRRFVLRRIDLLGLGSYAFLSLWIGNRGELLAPLLFALWAQHTYIRKIRVWQLVAMTTLVLVVFAAAGQAREGTTATHTGVGQSSINNISSTDFITANVLPLVPAEHHFYHGSTYLAAIERQLPGPLANAVFGPPATTTTPTGAYAYRQLIAFGNPNLGFSFAFPPEAYINFGMTGVLIMAALLGALFGWAYRRCRHDPRRALHLLYPILLAVLPAGLRDDSLGEMKIVLYPMVTLLVVLYLARRRAQRPERPSGAVPARPTALPSS